MRLITRTWSIEFLSFFVYFKIFDTLESLLELFSPEKLALSFLMKEVKPSPKRENISDKIS